MTETVVAHFTQRATRLQCIGIPDGQGGQTNDYVAVGMYGCALVRHGSGFSERIDAEQLEAVDDFDLHLPLGIEHVASDRWRVGGRVYESAGSNAGEDGAVTLVIAVRRAQ